MKVSDFDYNFPPELLAKHPPKVRGQSRLLVLDRTSGKITHHKYPDFADYVEPGDVVVLNDTKVIKARLEATNAKGQTRELLLLEKHQEDQDWHQHRALYRGHVEAGESLRVNNVSILIQALEGEGVALLQSDQDLLKLAEHAGTVPLPPYMKRKATTEDVERYQTEFATSAGSVAAPTASLNFTKELLRILETKGARVVYLTLHVGMGTFLPIRTDTLETHKMHSEYFEIPLDTITTIQAAKQTGHKIFAVGTTVTRTLEHLEHALTNKSHSPPQLKDSLLTDGQNVTFNLLSCEADIFIYPGYKFQVVDALLTNFHAPKSTVLMMAAAFAGWDNLQRAYEEAIKEKYALLSYGDSMLIH